MAMLKYYDRSLLKAVMAIYPNIGLVKARFQKGIKI